MVTTNAECNGLPSAIYRDGVYTTFRTKDISENITQYNWY